MHEVKVPSSYQFCKEAIERYFTWKRRKNCRDSKLFIINIRKKNVKKFFVIIEWNVEMWRHWNRGLFVREISTWDWWRLLFCRQSGGRSEIRTLTLRKQKINATDKQCFVYFRNFGFQCLIVYVLFNMDSFSYIS